MINQFIATAVAEKAAALLTVDYLEARGTEVAAVSSIEFWRAFRTCHRSQVTNCRDAKGKTRPF